MIHIVKMLAILIAAVILGWIGYKVVMFKFMFFLRSVIARDLLNIITIGFGFFVQATLMGLIIFK